MSDSARTRDASRVELPTVQLGILALICFGAFGARAELGPLQESVKHALSLSDAAMGVLQGPALAVPFVFASIPLGLAINRASRARLLLWLVVAEAGGSLLSLQSDSFSAMLLARAIVGLSANAIGVVALSLVSDLFEADYRGRATTVITIFELLGVSATFALGGLLQGNAARVSTSWHDAWLVLSTPILCAVALAFIVREPARIGSNDGGATLAATIQGLWGSRRTLAPLLLGAVMVTMSDGAAMIWAVPLLSRHLQLSGAAIGSFMGSAILLSGLMGPTLGGFAADWSHRVGGGRLTLGVASLFALASAPVALFGLASHVGTAFLALLAMLTLGSAIGALSMTAANVLLPPPLRGITLSLLVSTALVLGLGAAPLIVGLLASGPIGLGAALSVVCVSTALVTGIAFALAALLFPGNHRATRDLTAGAQFVGEVRRDV